MNKPVTEYDYAVFDFETTGLFPEYGHRVCELAVTVIDPIPGEGNRVPGYEVIDQFDTLVNPHREISSDAADVNGITSSMVQEAPDFSDVATRLLDCLRGNVLVAHNAGFDLGFLRAELDIPGLDIADHPVVDTCGLARQIASFENNRLGTIAGALDLDPPQHRAESDARVTSEILVHFLNESREQGASSLADLIELQGGPVSVPVGSSYDHLPAPLQEAVQTQTDLEIGYVSDDGRETSRSITPLRATRTSNGDYLIAYCHLRESQRTFRLDRIEKVGLKVNE